MNKSTSTNQSKLDRTAIGISDLSKWLIVILVFCYQNNRRSARYVSLRYMAKIQGADVITAKIKNCRKFHNARVTTVCENQRKHTISTAKAETV